MTVSELPPRTKGVEAPSLEDLFDDIRRTADLPLSKGQTLPAGAYTSRAFFDWEVENVFKKDWLALAHISQIPSAGDYVNLDMLGEPLSVVRGKDGQVRVLSRVCPHRAMDVMPEKYGYAPRGNQRMFVCPYHRWTFDLDGQVKGCPEMQNADGFNKRDWKLAEFRTEIWGGFVFVNFSGDAKPLSEQYADLWAHLKKWKPDEMKLVIEMEWDCKANWKIICENWIESYHHLGVHYQTLNPMMPAQDTWTEKEHAHFIRCHLPYKESLANEVKAANESGKRLPGFLPVPGLSHEDQTEWGLFLGYPMTQVLTTRDRVIWYRLQPMGPNRCKWLTTTLVTEESTRKPEFPNWIEPETKMLRDFHMEDMEVTEAVQAGLTSSKYVRGRLSHLEAPVWLVQRYLAARTLGTYPGK
jgi:phenylpropionate dioxygenase-like ring-hydroxylating dioxygenase large terminal subunit